MNLDDKIIAAILAELRRQAQAGKPLKVEELPDGKLRIQGAIDTQALAIAIAEAMDGAV